jgi:VanZ family protein
MGAIFWFSAQPSQNLPNFNWADRLVKKSGHATGYALLAMTYWRGLEWRKERWWLAWLLAILYALTDEYHQSFTPGRFPSLVDVFVFDTLGALFGLWLAAKYRG